MHSLLVHALLMALHGWLPVTSWCHNSLIHHLRKWLLLLLPLWLALPRVLLHRRRRHGRPLRRHLIVSASSLSLSSPLRCHPPGMVWVARVARQDVLVDGFGIAAHRVAFSCLLVVIWVAAVGRARCAVVPILDIVATTVAIVPVVVPLPRVFLVA